MLKLQGISRCYHGTAPDFT